MPDDEKRIITDDDWKEEARREKERLAEQEATAAGEVLPEPSLMELLNLIAIQAMVGLGLVGGPQGERIPPNLGIARHFIDLLAVLKEKTKGNVTPDEERMLDQVAYDLQMRYVEMSQGGPIPPPAEGPAA